MAAKSSALDGQIHAKTIEAVRRVPPMTRKFKRIGQNLD